jgi:predicted deacylase
VLADLDMIAQAASAPAAPPLVVEDDRPGAGHMQVNHPAPCEGFFEPAVALGQRVQAGDPLGTLSDLLGRHVEPVRAAHTGIVLVLHTFARVDAGESVGVVLEV